jgi:tetratricopeptide (TPR) repeat protein
VFREDMLYFLLPILAIVAGIVLYLIFAPGPRRWRAYTRAQKLLQADDWREALAIVQGMNPASLSSAWQARLDHLAGECHQRAIDVLLKEKQFEDALDHAHQVIKLLDLDEAEETSRVTGAALAEVRRLFVSGESEPLEAMIARVGKLTSEPPVEATFWHGLNEIRQGQMESSLTTLQTVHEKVGKKYIDPSLYLGFLLHRLGRPQEALRYLADANRLDSNCPFVTWQMGVSMVASGGDSGLAMRALQKALSTRGLLTWEKQPDRLWIESLPEDRSYVRRLASRHRYVCPLLGGDLSILLRQGQLALAQAFYRQDRFQEAAELYGKLLQDSPPTVMLLRGYGLALARQGQHDQAFKHLRIALEQEDPKDSFTAGYLALCGALGKPTNPDDKPRNIGWAIKLLAKYPVPNNAEWSGLIASVHAEARKVGVRLSVEDQELLCDSQASVQAHDPRAAVGYAHLAETFPDAVKPVYAWLYTRAAAVHGINGKNDLDLFARTFQHISGARAYFEKQGWDLGEVEYTYLSRCASQAPGQFPDVLGPDYAKRGEAFLLARSAEQEKAKQINPARESVEVLLSLAPKSVAAHDRLACLHYRTGNVARSMELLDDWHKLAPTDHWPLVRQAIIEQERGNAIRRAEVIGHALRISSGSMRASIAFLGAKLALRESLKTPGASLDAPRNLLELCLDNQAEHFDALWCLAAVRSAQGDRAALADQANRMDRSTVTESRFHYMGAVCHLAAESYEKTLKIAERAARDPALEIEANFVMAWAKLNLAKTEEAMELLRKVADTLASPSAIYAKALLGQLCHQGGNYEEAITWWSALEAPSRGRFALDEPLRHTVLLAGVLALKEKRYEQAADRFREAGKLGLRDKRLSGLITMALVKAGQRLLYEEVGLR